MSGGGRAVSSTDKVEVHTVPNNQSGKILAAKPLPADSYKNNLLKAKADEEKRAELKASQLNNDLSVSLKRCPLSLEYQYSRIFAQCVIKCWRTVSV